MDRHAAAPPQLEPARLGRDPAAAALAARAQFEPSRRPSRRRGRHRRRSSTDSRASAGRGSAAMSSPCRSSTGSPAASGGIETRIWVTPRKRRSPAAPGCASNELDREPPERATRPPFAAPRQVPVTVQPSAASRRGERQRAVAEAEAEQMPRSRWLAAVGAAAGSASSACGDARCACSQRQQPEAQETARRRRAAGAARNARSPNPSAPRPSAGPARKIMP